LLAAAHSKEWRQLQEKCTLHIQGEGAHDKHRKELPMDFGVRPTHVCLGRKLDHLAGRACAHHAVLVHRRGQVTLV
jgi:hypothetical protein